MLMRGPPRGSEVADRSDRLTSRQRHVTLAADNAREDACLALEPHPSPTLPAFGG